MRSSDRNATRSPTGFRGLASFRFSMSAVRSHPPWDAFRGWARISLYPLLRRAPSCDSRSEEHTSELQSLMRISYAVFCLKKKKKIQIIQISTIRYDNKNL